MDHQYAAHCVPGTPFYDRSDLASTSTDTAPAALFTAAGRPLPNGWRSAHHGDWLHLFPDWLLADESAFPKQGWKIHVSATEEGAEKTAADVWDYCVPQGISFKFVRGPHLWRLRNAKYAPRDGSGKLITIYPVDDVQLHNVLKELHEIIGGRPGPYVLTDLRWAEGPLYVRYGAFVRRDCVDDRGRFVSAVEDDQGRLVPDHRAPAFYVPTWVKMPSFLEPHLAVRSATTLAGLPYQIEAALHYSNGGGVYRGTDTRNGRTVILKEGRPHAGLATDGSDAITRLEREKAALEMLAGLGVAPAARDWFDLGDHRFLVMDFIEGRALNSFFARRHPLLAANPDPKAVAEYTEWALRIYQAVEKAVWAMHSRGLCFNDLHPSNIMVSPDEQSVTLVDFEASAPPSETGRQVAAHPGFIAPPGRTGTEVDRYALACLRLALFIPLTSLFAIDRIKASHFAEIVTEHFPDVPREFLQEAVAEITSALPEPDIGSRSAPRSASPLSLVSRSEHWSPHLPEPGNWPHGRDSMVRAILASATPDRDDRLFPGDIAQFSDGGGLGLAHGAAGVLYALAESGAERYEEGERWLLNHVDPLPPNMPVGLYNGLAGVILTLNRLGHTQVALDLTESLIGYEWHLLPSDLNSGLAGIGLLLDHLAHATGEQTFHERAIEAAQIIADRLAAREQHSPAHQRAGLLHGATGPALLFLRLHERTGTSALLDLARDALNLDLAQCAPMTGGALGVNEGWRITPSLGIGSVGIGAVLDDYLAHAPEQAAELAEARTGILLAARSRSYTQPGLFQGRAGLLWFVNRTTTPGVPVDEVRRQAASLGYYRMAYRGDIAFPGHQMMRLSMDLATGTAGCLLALATALGDHPAHLPFLPSRDASIPASRQ
ncbi:class III lanthionine synthetase LanKC [Streptomyces hesseae]|uniref:Class III lanthionine synthetase LanKC n=1 Tax=Streptomyces hesseae TaxID=3075519 RepID=A0ABU2SXK5_9ACTN|nr:class III lanthionine synthetase LanKC [Streptomyces sp. DSM 40473]MDT0453109.1 class III lanthionine synthetase LanKC [Streptomyces sp. DSM 40473]